MKQKHRSNLLALAIFCVLVVGVGIAYLAAQQSTENREHASSASDLNTASDIVETNNPDGTMGPATFLGNYSNNFPDYYLGSLQLQVTDPPASSNDKNVELPTQAQGHGNENKPSITSIPSISPAGRGNENAGGPQSVTALNLTVYKVEVHLAYLGVPGVDNSNTSPAPEKGKPSIIPGKTNQNVEHWETLDIGGIKTFDLVALAKTHDFSVLGITKLVNGRYTQIRLYVKSATATLTDGSNVFLTVLGKSGVVKVVQPFVINSGKKTTLTMDFDAQNSVIKAGDQYLLKPVVAHLLEQQD